MTTVTDVLQTLKLVTPRVYGCQRRGDYQMSPSTCLGKEEGGTVRNIGRDNQICSVH